MKRIYGLLVSLGLLSCVSQSNSGPAPIKPSVSMSTQAPVSVASTQPSPTSTPSPAWEVRPNGDVCLWTDYKTLESHLTYPVDLTVTPDGSEIYIVSKRCEDFYSTKPYYYLKFTDCSSSFPSKRLKDIEKNTEMPYTPVLPRKYIHQLNSQGQLKILKFNQTPPLSCELGEDIEIDNQGRLYVSAPSSHRIYRLDLSAQSVEQISEIKDSQHNADVISSDGPVFSSVRGPSQLYVENTDVYFSMQGAPENGYRTVNKRINSQSYQKVIQIQGGGSGSRYPQFAVLREQVYLWGTVPLPLPYPVSDEDPAWRFKFDPPSAYYPSENIVSDIKLDSHEDIYLSKTNEHMILRIKPDKSKKNARVETFAGSGIPGLKDGPAREAQFKYPLGLAIDAQDNLYVADTGNHAIRKITPNGTVTTLYAEKSQ